MPRKHPLPALDLGIAKRLTRLREDCYLSREDWAVRSGVARDTITRIEIGRTPLRYDDARKLLSCLLQGPFQDLHPLNPLWLSNGMQPRQLNWPFLLPLGADIGLPPVASFSSFVEANRAVLTALTQDVPEAALPESWLKPYVLHWLSLEGRVKRLDRGVMWLENVFEFSAKRLVPQSKAASMLLRQYEAYKKQLTTITTIRNTSDMKSEMQKLLAAVRGYTADFGKKSGLAKALGVPTTRISEWLGGKYEPSGEIALRLHKWVSEEVQRNQKALTVDQHSQSEETRLRHSHENRSQSNRRKT